MAPDRQAAPGTKLFLGGIATETTTEDIIEYFGQFGEIQDAIAMKKPDGQPRGFGFVTFEDPATTEAVLASEHFLHERRVDIKSADGKASPMQGGKGGPGGYARQAAAPPPRQQYQQFAPAPMPRMQYAAAPYSRAPVMPVRAFQNYAAPAPRPRPASAPPRQAQYAPQPVFHAKISNSEDGGKLFLGGINPHTTSAAINEFFSAYGEVIDSVAMKQADGRPRGFGFVTFADPGVAAAVVEEHSVNPIELDGRVIDLKSAAPRGEAPPPKQAGGGGGFFQEFQPLPVVQPTEPLTDKVFVGGLGQATQDELVEYFSQYGTLIDAVVIKDKATQKSRGFGYVQYDNYDSVEAIIADFEHHQIGGKWIEVKKSIPRDQCAMKGGAPGFGKGAQPMFQAQAPVRYAPVAKGFPKGGGKRAMPYGGIS